VREHPLILIVDDAPDNVEIVRARLESQGYDVITAADGLEAIEQVSSLTVSFSYSLTACDVGASSTDTWAAS
jgi:CheY-like chemotaxis protein